MSDLRLLASDLAALADLVPTKAKQAVQQTAMKSKAEWRRLARGNPLGKQYTSAIDYKLRNEDGRFEADIGPNLERYGGKTGRGGLVPSAGIFDDPLSAGSIRRPPDRARRSAEKFASDELGRGVDIALEQSLRERGF